jgi:hypothetical protein
MVKSATVIQTAWRRFYAHTSYTRGRLNHIARTIYKSHRIEEPESRSELESERLIGDITENLMSAAASKKVVENEEASLEESAGESSGYPPRCAFGTKVKKVRMLQANSSC